MPGSDSSQRAPVDAAVGRPLHHHVAQSNVRHSQYGAYEELLLRFVAMRLVSIASELCDQGRQVDLGGMPTVASPEAAYGLGGVPFGLAVQFPPNA